MCCLKELNTPEAQNCSYPQGRQLFSSQSLVSHWERCSWKPEGYSLISVPKLTDQKLQSQICSKCCTEFLPKARDYCPNYNFANTFKLWKNPPSYNPNFKSCFSLSCPAPTESPYCRVQKRNTWTRRKPQLRCDKVLLVNIYLQKRHLQFQTTWKYFKLEMSPICWSRTEVLFIVKALLHTIYNLSLSHGSVPVNPASEG